MSKNNTAPSGLAWCGLPLQMIAELERPNNPRIGWETNADLMVAAARELCAADERIRELEARSTPPADTGETRSDPFDATLPDNALLDIGGSKLTWAEIKQRLSAEGIGGASEAQPTPLPANEAWIPWTGGECPCPGRYVNVRYRGDLIGNSFLAFADERDWTHCDDHPGSDIIAYHIAQA